MTVSLSVNLIGDYVYLAATNNAGTATKFTVERYTDDGYVPVPGGFEAAPTSTNAFVVKDYDLPQFTTLLYRAFAFISPSWQVSVPVTVPYELDRGVDWLYDTEFPADGMPIYVESIGDMSRRNVVEQVDVLGRKYPVVASWGRKAETTTMTLLTLEEAERQQFLTIMDGSTLALSVRDPVNYGMPTIFYFVAGELNEARPSKLGYEPARRWQVTASRVNRPLIVGTANVGTNLWSGATPNPGETETWSQWTAARYNWAAVKG